MIKRVCKLFCTDTHYRNDSGYIGNSILFGIDDYEAFGRTISRVFAHVAAAVSDLKVPQESHVAFRYAGLEDKTPDEIEALREILREMRARIGRKRTRAAEMYSICMIDGQDHDGAMQTIREQLDDSYANLLQGSFDGGATTGKMIIDAFESLCSSRRLVHCLRFVGEFTMSRIIALVRT